MFKYSLMITRFFILKSNNIFRALSFESSLFESHDLKQTNYVLFWLSRPCVVIGRHQNPWNEVNMQILRSTKLPLVRRASGGGTVYHDLGNLNISFITDKANCNRDVNMSIISNALNRHFDKHSYVGKRHEIYVDDALKVLSFFIHQTFTMTAHRFLVRHLVLVVIMPFTTARCCSMRISKAYRKYCNRISY